MKGEKVVANVIAGTILFALLAVAGFAVGATYGFAFASEEAVIAWGATEPVTLEEIREVSPQSCGGTTHLLVTSGEDFRVRGDMLESIRQHLGETRVVEFETITCGAYREARVVTGIRTGVAA